MVRNTCKIYKGEVVVEALKQGSQAISDAVSTTFGPYGKNVAITKIYNSPHITKDGVTVANDVNLECPMQNVAAQTIKLAARKTAEIAGDGTSSTVILSNALVQNCFKAIEEGVNPFSLKKELEILSEKLIDYIITQSKTIDSIEDIKNIALVASNGDEELASLVTNAYEKIGKDGIVTLVESRSYETTIDVVEGIKLDRSYIDPSFSIGSLKTVYKEPNIIVTDLDLVSQEDAIAILTLQEASKKPLVIICNDIHRGALEVLVYNKQSRGVPIDIIRAPFIADARREAILDLSAATGAVAILKDAGWDWNTITSIHLGSADTIEINNKETNIIGRKGNEKDIQVRIDHYNEKIKNDLDGLKENYRKRLAMLTSGAAVIYIGGSNEIEITEKKDRLDDTIRAVKAALDQGVVIGGALGYINPYFSTEGDNILVESLYSIAEGVHKNSTHTPESWVKHIKENNIIDPTLVVTSTIKNAIGASAMIYTTDCIIVKNEQ